MNVSVTHRQLGMDISRYSGMDAGNEVSIFKHQDKTQLYANELAAWGASSPVSNVLLKSYILWHMRKHKAAEFRASVHVNK
jgi:hypothetical protein